MTSSTPTGNTRRAVLAGGAGVAALSACGGQESGGEGGTGEGVSVPAADVPVGGGVILAEAQTVVTQPSEGEYKAFTAVCPHQQCMVSQVANGSIHCACHGSTFSAADGSVTQGPATTGLAAKTATLDGDRVAIS